MVTYEWNNESLTKISMVEEFQELCLGDKSLTSSIYSFNYAAEDIERTAKRLMNKTLSSNAHSFGWSQSYWDSSDGFIRAKGEVDNTNLSIYTSKPLNGLSKWEVNCLGKNGIVLPSIIWAPETRISSRKCDGGNCLFTQECN